MNQLIFKRPITMTTISSAGHREARVKVGRPIRNLTVTDLSGEVMRNDRFCRYLVINWL